jgi:hypothetical protein
MLGDPVSAPPPILAVRLVPVLTHGHLVGTHGVLDVRADRADLMSL